MSDSVLELFVEILVINVIYHIFPKKFFWGLCSFNVMKVHCKEMYVSLSSYAVQKRFEALRSVARFNFLVDVKKIH